MPRAAQHARKSQEKMSALRRRSRSVVGRLVRSSANLYPFHSQQDWISSQVSMWPLSGGGMVNHNSLGWSQTRFYCHWSFLLSDDTGVLGFILFPYTLFYYSMYWNSLRVQGGWGGWPTGNGKKLWNSQACCLAQLCLGAA